MAHSSAAATTATLNSVAHCVLAPAYSVIAERENEELVGNEPVRPEAILPSPWPIRSWFSFQSLPARALSTLALDAVSRKLTRVIRKAGSSRVPSSLTDSPPGQ